MSVKLRLSRTGSKKRPFYRIVATDSRKPRDSKFCEILGYYQPLYNPYKLVYKEDRIIEWLKNGAEMSDVLKSLLKKEGVIKKLHELTQGGTT